MRRLSRITKGLIPFKLRRIFYKLSKKYRPQNGPIQIAYYPAFSTASEFSDQYWRIIWYLTLIGEKLGRVVIPFEGEKPQVDNLPSHFDKTAVKYETSIQDKIEYISVEESATLLDSYASSQAIIVWQHDKDRKLPDRAGHKIISERRKFFVDKRSERYESGNYLDIHYKLLDDHEEICEISHGRLKELGLEVQDRNVGYLFGTGPNLYEAIDRDFSDGYVIICNSMVKNNSLLELLQPKIVTIADPVFHAGISNYAGEFRNHLAIAMKKYNLRLIVPLRHFRVYERFLGAQLASQLIGIPESNALVPNLDLLDKFHVAEAYNIMTLLMLPLACSFFDTIYTIGFDGRPINEDDYFWKHDPKSQLVDQMDDAKLSHPAFFEIDYNGYYQQHLATLEKWVHVAEESGHKVYNLSSSHIPVLKERNVNATS
jgi:hypothetical protein